MRTRNLLQYAREVPRQSVLVKEHSCLDLYDWCVQLQGAPGGDVEAAAQESAQSPLPPRVRKPHVQKLRVHPGNCFLSALSPTGSSHV